MPLIPGRKSLILLLFLKLLTQIQAQTVVQNLSDSGRGSLREAIENSSSGEVITFRSKLSGKTLLLSGGALILQKDVIIDGSTLQKAVTIDPKGSSRVFSVESGKSVTLKNIVISNGADQNGGAILNEGSLNIENCTFHHNTAKSGNSPAVGHGGAIYSTGGISLTNCTLVSNRATGNGGAIHMEAGIATLNHCTITLNYRMQGDLDFGSDRLIGGLGGGEESSRNKTPHYQLRNCIVTGNYSNQPGNFRTSHNLDPHLLIEESDSANLVDHEALLAPLADFGGPLPTVMPMSGSAAIDAGSVSTLSIDQRGASRSSMGKPDLGSVETGSIPEFDVTSFADPVVTRSDDRNRYHGTQTGFSLREAIARARPNSVIRFAPMLSGEKIKLGRGQLELSKDLVVDGSSLQEPVRISGREESRCFLVLNGAEVTLRALNVISGFVDGDATEGGNLDHAGGGVLNFGTLTVERCDFRKNRANIGGGLASGGMGVCWINGCNFQENESIFDGGGAYFSGRTSLKNSTFLENVAGDSGGGFFLDGLDLEGARVMNCTLVKNVANSDGGAFINRAESVRNCTIVDNSADFLSGGVGIENSGSMDSCIVYGNKAPLVPDFSSSPNLSESNNLIGEDPLLGVLQDNGGSTLTMMPLPGSPAIDPVDGAVSENYEVDQRDHYRMAGPSVDIGAVEANSSQFPARKNELVVTSLEDSFQQTSDPNLTRLTLREAIAFSSPGAVITFSPDLTETDLMLSLGSQNLPHSLTIDGSHPTARIRLDAQKESRIFEVPVGLELVLKNLQLINGKISTEDFPPFFGDPEIVERKSAGGAIFASGNLVIDHCSFSNCKSAYHGGAIASLSGLAVVDSTFTECIANGSGGAIWTYSRESSLRIERTNFEQNQSIFSPLGRLDAAGGAVAVILPGPHVEIGECYFLGNRADVGGAVFSLSQETQLDNSTMVRNAAVDGFVIATFSPERDSPDGRFLRVVNCTIHANESLRKEADRGGPFVFGDVEVSMTHCTMTQNLSNSSRPIFSYNPVLLKNSIVSSNLGELNAPGEAALATESEGNFVGAEAFLSPLGDFGGLWPTLVPLEGSPTLGIGIPTEIQNDQRGFSRVSGDQADAGAVERRISDGEIFSVTDPVVTSGDDPLFWTGDISNLSLRHALDLAAPGSRVTFDADLEGTEIELKNRPLIIARSQEIDASGLSDRLGLGSASSNQLLSISAEGSLLLTNVQINEDSFEEVSPVFVRGRLEMEKCYVTANTSVFPLVRVNGPDARLEATNCHFGQNEVDKFGSILLGSGGSGSFERCSFAKNRNRWGGVINAENSFVPGATLMISSSTFQGNSSTEGGAISTSIPTTISSCTISNNRASISAGGIFAKLSTLEMTNSVVAGNHSPTDPQVAVRDVILGTNFLSGDPLLAPASFAGGTTMTMVPLIGSPLVDAGVATNETIDQRGKPRTVGSATDLGAVEFQGDFDELLFSLNLDTDGDGVRDGIEIATGSALQIPNDRPDLNLRVLPDGSLSTGFDPDRADLFIFKVTRSNDMINFDTVILSNETLPLFPENGLLFFDDPEAGPRAFYRIEIELR